MKHFNWFYFTVVILGLGLFYILSNQNNSDLSFYGFAESNETKINYNYPVVIDQILVTPGQEVRKGAILMHISRRKSKETLDHQRFDMAELKSKESAWKQKKENEVSELQLEQNIKTKEIQLEINQLQKEISYKKSIIEGLENIKTDIGSYNPLFEKYEQLQSKKKQLILTYDLRIQGLEKELQLGSNPYQDQINKLKAEQQFDESQKVQKISVIAPNDGLIGNISCKEEEHIPSYSTLLTFYEPHSGFIRGYVHEDLTLQVKKGDVFTVSSLKDATISYEGRVTGLGSRIIEIPNRLRKIPNIKTYGREVLVEITIENTFLQKEKVSLNVNPSKR